MTLKWLTTNALSIGFIVFAILRWLGHYTLFDSIGIAGICAIVVAVLVYIFIQVIDLY